MRILPLFVIFPAIFLSCEKEGTNLKEICFKGRYVATGCTDVVQLLEPLDHRLPVAEYWGYEHAFGTPDIPAIYKTGEPFYFKIKKIDSVKLYLTYCTPTKYYIEIEDLSSSPCAQPNN